MALSDAKVKAATVPEGKKQTKLADGGGLYLLVKPQGKYWRLDYRFADKRKTMALGVYPTVSLKNARKAREAAKELLSQGIDPNQAKAKEKQARKAEAIAVTFAGVADEWMNKKGGAWSASTVRGKKSKLDRHILPWIGKMKLEQIEPMDILQICERIENNGHHEAAHRVKMICGQVFRYGVATGRIKSDPTRDLHGALTPVTVTHHPCLKSAKQVGEMMRAIKEHQGTFVVHSALKLSPYVMLRPVELRTLEWAEINLETKQATIPAHKMKMRLPHIVPLSKQSLAILEEIYPLTGGGKYVFTGGRSVNRPMSDGAINAALRRMGYDTKKEHCAHGFRGMASTLLHELGYNSDHIERQLAHKEGNAIKAAYNHARHLPERVAMMQHWADYLDGLRDGAEVIPINRRA